MISNKHDTKRDIGGDLIHQTQGTPALTDSTITATCPPVACSMKIVSWTVRKQHCRWNKPWSNEMPDSPQHGQEYKDGSSGDVSPTKERVLSANPRNRRDDNGFRTLV